MPRTSFRQKGICGGPNNRCLRISCGLTPFRPKSSSMIYGSCMLVTTQGCPLTCRVRRNCCGFANRGSHTKKRWTPRTVFFGHTTTTKLGDTAGEVAFSTIRLDDGRPAWVGLDVGAYNHVSPGLAAVNIATFRVTKQPTLKCDRWFERIDKRVKNSKKKKKTWKGVENLKEAEIARSFGLQALALRAKKARPSTLRARQELERVGVVFPPAYSNTALQQAHTQTGYRIVRRQHGVPDSAAPRGPRSFRVYRKRHPLLTPASPDMQGLISTP